MKLLTHPSGLVRYDAACRAVADAKTVDEVKDIRDKSEAMRCYARQAHNPQLEADAWEIRKRAEDKLGELSAELDKAAAHGGQVWLPNGGKSKSEVLKDVGISTSAANRYEQFHRLPVDEKETRIAKGRAVIEAGKSAAEAIIRGTQGTGENEWYTPPDIIRVARSVLGAIDLDPASSEQAQGVVQAKQFFTLQDDGLARMWHGNVWLNPPYAQPFIEQFADKMIEEVAAGRIASAIMLTHNYTDTAWFQKLATASKAICFPRGRIRFVAPDGSLAAPTQGQAFFYFGNDSARFVETFCALGLVGALQ
jgi:phage N-6-adenine-methyltransferase